MRKNLTEESWLVFFALKMFYNMPYVKKRRSQRYKKYVRFFFAARKVEYLLLILVFHLVLIPFRLFVSFSNILSSFRFWFFRAFTPKKM